MNLEERSYHEAVAEAKAILRCPKCGAIPGRFAHDDGKGQVECVCSKCGGMKPVEQAGILHGAVCHC